MQNTLVKNQQIKSFEKKFKDILDREKQLVNFNKKLHPIGTLVMNFHTPEEESNMYVRFV